jgi:hypothetical protein
MHPNFIALTSEARESLFSVLGIRRILTALGQGPAYLAKGLRYSNPRRFRANECHARLPLTSSFVAVAPWHLEGAGTKQAEWKFFVRPRARPSGVRLKPNFLNAGVDFLIQNSHAKPSTTLCGVP